LTNDCQVYILIKLEPWSQPELALLGPGVKYRVNYS